MLPKPCSFLSTSEIQDKYKRELRSFCLLRRSGLARPSNLQRKQLSHALTPPLQQRGRGLYYMLQWTSFLLKLVAHTLSHSPFTEEGEGPSASLQRSRFLPKLAAHTLSFHWGGGGPSASLTDHGLLTYSLTIDFVSLDPLYIFYCSCYSILSLTVLLSLCPSNYSFTLLLFYWIKYHGQGFIYPPRAYVVVDHTAYSQWYWCNIVGISLFRSLN